MHLAPSNAGGVGSKFNSTRLSIPPFTPKYAPSSSALRTTQILMDRQIREIIFNIKNASVFPRLNCDE